MHLVWTTLTLSLSVHNNHSLESRLDQCFFISAHSLSPPHHITDFDFASIFDDTIVLLSYSVKQGSAYGGGGKQGGGGGYRN